MKIIIAGSRGIGNANLIIEAIQKSNYIPTEIVCGLAKGIDTLGKEWAEKNNIPVKEFPADWEKYGKSAGYRRNVDMAEYADALIAVWDMKSKGTEHMINIMRNKKKQVFLLEAPDSN